MVPQIVIDTNVLVAAMLSGRGASHALLRLLGKNYYELHVSVPLVTEYRDVLGRFAHESGLTAAEVEELITGLCAATHLHRIHFLWRPFLPDSKDDLVLEIALAARAQFIVTYNLRHFPGIERFGIQAVPPLQLLRTFGDVE